MSAYTDLTIRLTFRPTTCRVRASMRVGVRAKVRVKVRAKVRVRVRARLRATWTLTSPGRSAWERQSNLKETSHSLKKTEGAATIVRIPSRPLSADTCQEQIQSVG